MIGEQIFDASLLREDFPVDCEPVDMRKIEMALVVVLVAAATACWSQKSQTLSSVIPIETSHRLQTRSGRHEIHSPPYILAGVPIGSNAAAVTAVLGKPDREGSQGLEDYNRWYYERDGQTLTVTFLEELVIGVGGTGRWGFVRAGKPGMTLFMQPRSKIVANFGEPGRTDKNVVTYDAHPGELTLHYSEGGTVEQFWVVGEVKPLTKK